MVPKVLLLTGNAPGTQGVGQLFLRDLVAVYPRDRIVCFAVVEPGMESNAPDLAWLPIEYARKPREGGVGRFGPAIRGLTGSVARSYYGRVTLPAIARQLEAFARRHEVDMIWAVLSSPALIELAALLSRRLDLPMVTTVWDPPEMLTGNLGYGPRDRAGVESAFAEALRRSTRTGVASDGMADEYRAKYGITPVVQIRGASPVAGRGVPGPATPGRLTIAFAGSIYTVVEWRALLAALDGIHWRLGGREIRLRILATQFPLERQAHWPIDLPGWRSSGESLAMLAEADVLYLPYWFDDDHRDIVRLCFPNKLATYVAAGRPVLFHGPRDSSPARFMAQYPVGVTCHSNRAEDIVAALRRFEDPAVYAQAAAAGRRAEAEQLGEGVFLDRFAELMGVDPAVIRG